MIYTFVTPFVGRALKRTFVYIVMAFGSILIVSCRASSPPEVNWSEYVSGSEATRAVIATELESEVKTAIETGDCKAMQDWFDYSLARRKMATNAGRTLSTDMTAYVDHYMRGGMDCYDSSGRLKERGNSVALSDEA